MDMESITLNEVIQRKTNTVYLHLYVKYKKVQQSNKYKKIETDSEIQRTS